MANLYSVLWKGTYSNASGIGDDFYSFYSTKKTPNPQPYRLPIMFAILGYNMRNAREK